MAESTFTGRERIAAAFAAARDEGRAALMPYLMGGFPDAETSLAVAESYAESGADLIELGVPFSDPLADGPVIHAAAVAALRAGARVDDVLFEVGRPIAARIPVIVMCYANPIYVRGLGRFADPLVHAGRRRTIRSAPFPSSSASSRARYAVRRSSSIPVDGTHSHRHRRPVPVDRAVGAGQQRLRRDHDRGGHGPAGDRIPNAVAALARPAGL